MRSNGRQYLVRIECGKTIGKGGQACVSVGEFYTMDAAVEKLWQIAKTPCRTGYRTVMIAQKNAQGSYAAGPYSLNVVYQVTEEAEVGTAARPSKQGVWR